MAKAPTKSSRKRAGPRLYFLTNRMNALPVVSGGVIQPAVGLSKVYGDLFTATPGCLPLWVGPCPSNLEPVVSGGRAGVFPVAFEIDPRRLRVKSAPSIGIDDQVGTSQLDGDVPECRCIFAEIVVPISSLVRIHFRTEDELRDFSARDFANTELNVVPASVSPDIFDGPPIDVARITDVWGSSPKVGGLTAEHLRLCDALGGAVAMLSAELPPGREWSAALQSLLHSRPSVKSSTRAGMIVSSLLLACGLQKHQEGMAGLDFRFLRAGLAFALGTRSSSGWVSTTFIDAIVKGASEGASDAEKRDIDAWSKYALEVAKAERQPLPLDDSGSVVRRALILLLLRPDPERLVKARSSGLQPGDEVIATAAILCGALFGLSMLPKSLKSRSAFSTGFPGLLSEWMNRKAPPDSSATSGAKLKASVEVTEEQAPLGRIVVKIDGDTLAERTVHPPDSLMRVFYKAKQLKLDISYDWESKSFRVQLPIGHNRQQVVFVSEGRRDRKGRLSIRFVSPCMRLGRAGLRREQAVDLLKRNGSMDLDCRFSVSEDEQYVVVQAEQLLDTMDIEELEAHLDHVAQVADDYEQVSGQGDLF
jgi:hypothetical protein